MAPTDSWPILACEETIPNLAFNRFTKFELPKLPRLAILVHCQLDKL